MSSLQSQSRLRFQPAGLWLLILLAILTCGSEVRAQVNTSSELRQLHGLVNQLLNAGRQDSLLTVIQQGRQLASEEGDIKELAYFTYTLGSAIRYQDEQRSRMFLDSALILSRLIDYEIGEMLVYSSIGNSYRNVGQFDSAIHYLEKSHAILSKQDISPQKVMAMANSYQSLGLVAKDKGDYQTAMRYFVEAHEISLNNNLIQHANFFQHSIATIHYNMREFEKAEAGFNSVYDYADSAENSQLKTWATLGLAELAIERKDFDTSLIFYKQALNLVENQGNASKREVLFETARLFIHREETDSARHYLTLTAELTGPEHFKSAVKIEQAYAQVYQLEEKYEEAIARINRVIAMAKKEDVSAFLAQSLKLASDIYVSSGDYEKGYDYFLQYNHLQDSLFNETNLGEINALQIQYETDLKNEKIKDLQLLAQTQLSKITQKNLLVFLTILASILLILLIYSIYRQRTIKARNNEILARQRLSNAQLNPHFLYNSLSAIQRLILDNEDAVKTSGYVAKFSKLTRQMLSFTEKENIALASELEFLKNYLDLQKLRFGDNFDYEISIPPDMETELISLPPMITQPFVENALEHGFAQKTSADNKLSILVQESENQLTILIEDNGIGIDRSLQIHKQKEKSMAIRITKDRLKFLSKRTGKPATVSISDLSKLNPQSTGTRIQLNLPIL